VLRGQWLLLLLLLLLCLPTCNIEAVGKM